MKRILLVGGIGKMKADYQSLMQSLGYELEYAESKIPSRLVSRVIVISSVCSHPLMEKARMVASEQGVPICYVRKPSISSIRQAIDNA